MRSHWTGRTIRHMLLTVFAALSCGCAGNTASGPAGTPADSLSLADALAQVEAVDLSALDPEAARELRENFSSMLIASGKTHFVAAVVGVGVSDLAVADNGDGTATFHWTYLNTGDFDQNSETNVADLTPLGVHLNHSTSDGVHDPADQVVDGDRNGQIIIAELSVLGANLLNRLDLYHLEVSLDSGANWSNVEDVPFASSQLPSGGGFRFFDVVVDHPQEPAWYRVVSVGAGMEGLASNIVDYQAGAGPQIENLVATQGTLSGGVDLSWNSHPDAGYGYGVHRGDSASGPWTLLESTLTNSYSDTTALPEAHYWYQVDGYNIDGAFGMSDAAEGWASVPLPAPPGNLAASDGTLYTSVNLTWEAVSGASMYHVWRSDTAGSGHVEIGTAPAPTTTYDDFTATISATYYYYVTAQNTAGQGAPSNEDDGWKNSINPPILEMASGAEPPTGDGTAANPYHVTADSNWQFAMTGGDGTDATTSPRSTYTTGDVNVTISGNMLLVGAAAVGSFDFYGTYGFDSNHIYFTISAAVGPVIAPYEFDFNWQQIPNYFDPDAGTSANPFIMHDTTTPFNPDLDSDGNCEMQFFVQAEDQDGNPIDNETLEWGCFPPDMAPEINTVGSKGSFRVTTTIQSGYVFAWDAGLNESNHIYIEVAP